MVNRKDIVKEYAELKKKNVDELLSLINVDQSEVKSEDYFLQALTAPCFSKEYFDKTRIRLLNNDALATVGDTVLKMILSEQIFLNNKFVTKGKITIIKKAYENNFYMQNLLISRKLKKLMLYRCSRFLIGYKNMATALEAVIGACYLELGLEKTRKVVNECITNLKIVRVNAKMPKNKVAREIKLNLNQKLPEYYINKNFCLSLENIDGRTGNVFISYQEKKLKELVVKTNIPNDLVFQAVNLCLQFVFSNVDIERMIDTKKLGLNVKVIIDRPIGTLHKQVIYPINYGYIEGILGGDGSYQDCYILGVEKPIKAFSGKIIAIIHRENDNEDKYVVADKSKNYSKEEIIDQVDFIERFFKTWIEI